MTDPVIILKAHQDDGVVESLFTNTNDAVEIIAQPKSLLGNYTGNYGPAQTIVTDETTMQIKGNALNINDALINLINSL